MTKEERPEHLPHSSYERNAQAGNRVSLSLSPGKGDSTEGIRQFHSLLYFFYVRRINFFFFQIINFIKKRRRREKRESYRNGDIKEDKGARLFIWTVLGWKELKETWTSTPQKLKERMKNRFFSPLSSFLSFRFSSSIAPSRRFHLSLMSHVTNSTAPLRVLLGSSSFLISGEVLISDFRFALPFFTTLYTHTCIFVWMRVCALDYPPPFDIHTQHIYIYIYFLISLWP